jgi:hypothetical protein
MTRRCAQAAALGDGNQMVELAELHLVIPYCYQ